jgi:hypothetical protein
MQGNKNAEKWTPDEARAFMDSALELSKDRSYDFIGEIARDMDSYKEIFGYLSDKFPELQSIHNHLISNCEANCFYNSKKGNIKEATAIVNLKSNHGWTDRQQLGVTGNIELRFDKDDAHA